MHVYKQGVLMEWLVCCPHCTCVFGYTSKDAISRTMDGEAYIKCPYCDERRKETEYLKLRPEEVDRLKREERERRERECL